MSPRMIMYLTAAIIFLSLCTSTVARAGASPLPVIKKAVSEAAAFYKIDPKLVLAVIQVESSFNPRARGDVGEVGLMQLHPRFFPDADFDIHRNIWQGTEFLAYVRENCPQKRDLTWINCYNVGFKYRFLHPKKFNYYQKVMKAYREQKT